MFRNMTRLLLVLFAGIFVVGCASARTTPGQSVTTRKLETNFYVEDRPRVDQEMTGNFGYIMGTPQPEDRSQYRDTRRVYVLEVTKNVEEALQMQEVKIDPYVPSPSRDIPPAPRAKEAAQPDWAKPVVIPAFDDNREMQAAVPEYEDYVIQDGDTLQKISKKFYGSYSQWTRIYDANKDVLKDPNRVRSGIKIRIPLSGEGATTPVENLK